MNLFLISWIIKECVEGYFDKHVNKMIIEYAQLLSTVHWVHTDSEIIEEWLDEGNIYRASKGQINNPIAVWVREHINNYRFLTKLAKALCDEYYYRYGSEKSPPKRHKTEKIIDFLIKNEPKYDNVNKELIGPYKVTEPVQAMPDKYKEKDVIQAYRNLYLSEEKADLAKWKKREPPQWFLDEVFNF